MQMNFFLQDPDVADRQASYEATRGQKTSAHAALAKQFFALADS